MTRPSLSEASTQLVRSIALLRLSVPTLHHISVSIPSLLCVLNNLDHILYTDSATCITHKVAPLFSIHAFPHWIAQFERTRMVFFHSIKISQATSASISTTLPTRKLHMSEPVQNISHHINSSLQLLISQTIQLKVRHQKKNSSPDLRNIKLLLLNLS